MTMVICFIVQATGQHPLRCIRANVVEIKVHAPTVMASEFKSVLISTDTFKPTLFRSSPDKKRGACAIKHYGLVIYRKWTNFTVS
jgi:hypothetical protein